jgi:hypothetical protein
MLGLDIESSGPDITHHCFSMTNFRIFFSPYLRSNKLKAALRSQFVTWKIADTLGEETSMNPKFIGNDKGEYIVQSPVLE